MLKLEVFDPPMCCSTGVCGPAVDPVLPKFAADLDWLRSQGVQVERHNLTQEAAAFVANDLVKWSLAEEGEKALPLILAGGKIVSRGVYPTRQELAAFAGVTPGSAKRPLSVSQEAATESKACCGGSDAGGTGSKCCG